MFREMKIGGQCVCVTERERQRERVIDIRQLSNLDIVCQLQNKKRITDNKMSHRRLIGKEDSKISNQRKKTTHPRLIKNKNLDEISRGKIVLAVVNEYVWT